MTRKHTFRYRSCLQNFSTKLYYGLDLWPPILKNNMVPHFMMVIVWSESIRFSLYPSNKVFLLSYAMALTFDLEKQKCSSSHEGDQVYKVIKLECIRFGLYPSYKVFLLSNTTALTFDLWPQKTIGFLLSWWWSSVFICMTRKHTLRSLSHQNSFTTK
jgi:hypothetical protein